MLAALIILLLILEKPRSLIGQVDPAYVCSELDRDECPFPPERWDGSKFISIAGITGSDTVLEFSSFGKGDLLITDLSCRFFPDTFVVQNVTLLVFLEESPKVSFREVSSEERNGLSVREGFDSKIPKTHLIGEYFCSARSNQNISVTRRFPLEKGRVTIRAKYGTPPSLLSYIVASGIWLV